MDDRKKEPATRYDESGDIGGLEELGPTIGTQSAIFNILDILLSDYSGCTKCTEKKVEYLTDIPKKTRSCWW